MPFPVEPQYVAATEARLGVSFPSSFVAKMVRLNGGEIYVGQEAWYLYPFLDPSDRRRLKRTCSDIVHETSWSREHVFDFPPTAVAIAGNGGGDQLVFVADPHDPSRLDPRVYVWSHENGELEPVAEDFSELLQPPDPGSRE